MIHKATAPYLVTQCIEGLRLLPIVARSHVDVPDRVRAVASRHHPGDRQTVRTQVNAAVRDIGYERVEVLNGRFAETYAKLSVAVTTSESFGVILAPAET
jgi:hypothetical protein